jgi:glutaconate CoA-transferase, subunit B
LEEVRANTGWAVKVLSDLVETPLPSTDELAALRAVDPDGFWH